MAFEVQKINPLDLQPRKAVGVSLPFSGNAVFNSTYQTKDAIKHNLINFFLTGKGERFLNPTFGSGLRKLLFEQLTQDKAREIEDSAKESLRVYFPRVVVTEFELNKLPDYNTVEFILRYQVKDTNIEDELVINFEQ